MATVNANEKPVENEAETEDQFPKVAVWLVVAILAFVAFAWIVPQALMPPS